MESTPELLESAPASASAESGARASEPAPDWQDRYLRLAADFENFRKRKAREALELRGRAIEGVVLEFLPSLDHLEMAVAHAPAGVEAGWAEGLRLVLADFHDALSRLGVTAIAPAEGDPFDPIEHEAIERTEAESAPAAGAVTRLHAKGFRSGGRLLRPARVSVSVPPGR